ncbi:MAG TPA: DUF6607 family protein [Flavobacteriaceae bacterium]|nr:DUF6607 family protein [Flavobacteriaceae bacterium]
MNAKNFLFLAVFGLCFSTSFAQKAMSKKQQDIAAIKDMCGCFEVDFKYAETFAPDIAYEKAYNYTAKALEWAKLIEEEDGKLVIQHILVINDTMTIKHWRQDWIYEADKRFEYVADDTWDFKEMPENKTTGTWTQKVYHVDDSPRYSGTATWVHVDGRHFWQDRADSPLPRREYSHRDDYNIMNRGNHVEITDFGWVHDQDNKKVVRKNSEDVLLAQEKGINTYVRVADERCAAAKKWWAANKEFWGDVRDKWNDVYDREGSLQLKDEIDGKPLYRQLFPMDIKASNKKIDETIEAFLVKKS